MDSLIILHNYITDFRSIFVAVNQNLPHPASSVALSVGQVCQPTVYSLYTNRTLKYNRCLNTVSLIIFNGEFEYLKNNPYKHPSFNAKLNESLIKKGVIDLRYAIKTSVDEKIFSKQELEMLNLTNIDPGLKSITWRGTSILPHTLYRGIATMKPPLDGEELIRSNFINNVCAMKKGDLFSFNNGVCHELLTFTSYDYKEAARFCDLANVLKFINKRALFEIEMPRNSHMFVYPEGDQGLVCLPVNNIYELIENPQIIKTKVITFGNQINDSEFILIKLKLKQENL